MESGGREGSESKKLCDWNKGVPTISFEFQTKEEKGNDDNEPEDQRRGKYLIPAVSSLNNSQTRSLSLSIPSRDSRRASLFNSILQTSVSEGARLNEEKAAELEGRLKKLATAFSARTRKTKAEIRRPPTPSSEESDSDISTAVSENNLLHRLETFLPTPYTSRRPSLQQLQTDGIKKLGLRPWRKGLEKVWRLLTLRYLLDPQGTTYVCWLGIVSLAFLYNAWVLPLREVFEYQDSSNSPLWFTIDSFLDIVYVFDLLLFKSHVRFVQEGFSIESVSESWKIYIRTTDFKMDLLSLMPLDVISYIYYHHYPWLRLPRLLKITTFWELFARLDTRLASPFIARISKTLLYMLYMIHLNASAYYALSMWEGKGTTEWTYGYGNSGNGNAYIRCFYFATKTATSIGKNPRPSNEIEYLFMTFAWLSGVFIFALLLGQIRDIIATATKAQTDYRQVCYTTFNYLHRLDVPKHLQNKVKSWLNYTWEAQKTLDEGEIIAQLPIKMQADLALHVHIETLSKVKLFRNCETAFLRDLVVKLRSIIFLPGDYVCRKGEVGKEMYIIRTGRVNVIGGATGHDVLATLTSGSVFGEIALLAIGGMTKRTADVRTAGFSNLYVLNKADLNQAIKDYPQAQESLRRKAKKIIRENMKKRKAEAQIAERAKKEERLTMRDAELNDEKIIIKNKSGHPRLVDAVLRAISPTSMTARYLKYGSKASSIDLIIGDESTSYPPSPYLPASPSHLTQKLIKSYTSDSDDDLNYILPTGTPGIPPNLNISLDEDDDVFSFEQKAFENLQSLEDENYFEPTPTVGTSAVVMVTPPAAPVTYDPPESPRMSVDSSSSESDKNRFQLQRQFSMEVASDSDEN